jgi:hypothetical protein
MGVHLLWTFFIRQIQLVEQQVTKMWLHPRPSCPDRSFCEKLGDVEINTQIHKVLAYGADLSFGAGPTLMREGVDSTRVSPFGYVFFLQFAQFHPLIVLVTSCSISSMLISCRGASTCPRAR